jgi:hypothetical protein
MELMLAFVRNAFPLFLTHRSGIARRLSTDCGMIHGKDLSYREQLFNKLI